MTNNKTENEKIENQSGYKVGKYHPPLEYRFKKGNPGGGRKKGSLDKKTIFFIALKEVAKKLRLGEEPDAVKVELVKRGIKEGLGANYPFWKDMMKMFRLLEEEKSLFVDDAIEEIEIKIKKNKEDKEDKENKENKEDINN